MDMDLVSTCYFHGVEHRGTDAYRCFECGHVYIVAPEASFCDWCAHDFLDLG